MTIRKRTLDLAWFSALSLIAIPAYSQPQDTTEGQDPVNGQRAAIAQTQSLGWLEKTIDVSISRASVVDAIKQILAAAKMDSEKVTSQFALPADLQISLEVKKVKARDALAAVARLGGGVAWVSSDEGKVSVELRRRTDAPPIAIPMPPTPGTNRLNPGVTVNPFTGSFTTPGIALTRILPDKKVSLDKRNADLRGLLKDLLKQADVDFVIEDSVPDDVKKSFTFEDVPLSAALNLVCQSADLSWRADMAGGKLLLRIGKRQGVSSPRGTARGDLRKD